RPGPGPGATPAWSRPAAAPPPGGAGNRVRPACPAATTRRRPPAGPARRCRWRCAGPARACAPCAVRAAPRSGLRALPGSQGTGTEAGPSEARPDAEVHGERRVRVIQPARDVQPQRADRCLPAHAGADAGAQRGTPVEGAAGVGEGGHAPGAVAGVMLLRRACGDDVARAQRGAVVGRVEHARSDLAPFVAADAAVAASIEAQARWHVYQRVGLGAPVLAAQDQPVV